MSLNNKTASRRHVSAKAVAGVAILAVLVLGVSTGPASARWDDRGDHRDDHRGDDRGWNNGGYVAPPVVYGGPAYYAPPVVYGPSVGIAVPGVAIVIR